MTIRYFCLLAVILSTVGCSSTRLQNEVVLGPYGTLRQDGSDAFLTVCNHGPGIVTGRRVRANGAVSEAFTIAATEGLGVLAIEGDVIVVENRSLKLARLSLSGHDRLSSKMISNH